MNQTILMIVGGLVALTVLAILIYHYNQLARRKNQIEHAISSADALFIKRSDLIPNLIATVQKYMAFEEDTLKQITALRGMNSATPARMERNARMAFDQLMVQVEQYPDLKASAQFRDLQYSMNEVEEQIAAGRRYISASITDYNNAIRLFPSNMVATITGFKHYEWQYASEQERAHVDAKQLFES